MTLLIYLAIFLAAMSFRLWGIVGGGLSEKINSAGIPYLEKVQVMSKSQRARLFTGLPLTYPTFFSVTRERWYHRMLKNFGLTTEVQLGDEELDRKLFFTSDSPESLEYLAANQEFRQQIRELFITLGAVKLQAFRKKIWAVSKIVPAEKIPGAFTEEHRVAVEKIGQLCESAPAPSSVEGGIGKGYVSVGFMLTHMALFFVGVFGFLPMMYESYHIINQNQFIFYVTNVALLISAVWLGLIVMNLRGTGWFALVFADFVLFGLLGIFLAGFFVMREVNIVFDHSAPVVYHQSLISKSCSLYCRRNSGRHGSERSYKLSSQQCDASNRKAARATYGERDSMCKLGTRFQYYLTLSPSEENRGNPLTFETSSFMYDSALPGDIFDVPLRAGFLKVEWLDTDTITPQR